MATTPQVTFGHATGQPATPNVLVLTHALGAINGFYVDCLLSDHHTFDAEITDFPVESGSTISDNIRNKPLVVVMDCLVSNSPIGQLATLRDKVNEPADAAYDMLLKIRDSRAPVTILTSLRTYTNMALQNLSVPRDSGRGDELRFTATFKQIETVQNKRDKRVAIVGAQNGGNNTVTGPLLQTAGLRSVYIHTLKYMWYDFNIQDWRSAWRRVPPVRSPASAPPLDVNQFILRNAGPGQFILSIGKPLHLSSADWNSRSTPQRADAIVRAALDKIRGTRNFFNEGSPPNEFRYLVTLTRYQYTFERTADDVAANPVRPDI